MAIKKQEFYEGAALHQLSCSQPVAIAYLPPFFILNDRLSVLLKYCTKGRSPWNFTFTAREQAQIQARRKISPIMLGLVCGDDGVAAIECEAYFAIARPRGTPVHVACFRRHGEHYEVCGPDGTLDGKVPPSRWKGILIDEGQ